MSRKTPHDLTPADREAARRVRWCRERLALTQEQLADEAGCSRETVSAVENGRTALTRRTATLLATALGTPVAWLRTGRGPSGTSAEGTPEYGLGPLSHAGDVPPAVVYHRDAYHCGTCSREVGRGLARCPHCGTPLDWTMAGGPDDGRDET